MKGFGWFIAALVCTLAGVPDFARAQDEAIGGSYLTPFPPGELYNMAVIGDDMADGLQFGLSETLTGDRRIALRAKQFILNGLNRPDFAEKITALEDDLKREPLQVAVVMLGAWDRVSLRDPSGKKLAVGSVAWRAEYAQRADRLMKLLKRLNISVYWVGLPNVRKADANDDAQMINEILRERSFLNGMRFVDVYAGFLDEQGGYDAFGPDLTGKIVRLRDGDGVYFTADGNRKLAHFVERDLKRDLTQARADRDVPLAGGEPEQAKINPDKAKLAEPAPGAATKTGDAAVGAAAASAVTTSAASAAASALPGEQKAETGKISLKTVSASGREETLNLDIVRPAIAASVVQLVTRRESADKPAQMGDNLVDQISGGLLVMTSVSPSSGQGARDGAPKVSAAQTPYFRVLFRGERLQPKPGRADDMSWPRPGSAAVLDKTSKAVAPSAAAPSETGSTGKSADGNDPSEAPATEPKKRKTRDRD